MAESRGKRFYRVVEGRGYTLAFEARSDVYPRVSPLSNCPTEQSGLDDVFNFLCS